MCGFLAESPHSEENGLSAAEFAQGDRWLLFRTVLCLKWEWIGYHTSLHLIVASLAPGWQAGPADSDIGCHYLATTLSSPGMTRRPFYHGSSFGSGQDLTKTTVRKTCLTLLHQLYTFQSWEDLIKLVEVWERNSQVWTLCSCCLWQGRSHRSVDW